MSNQFHSKPQEIGYFKQDDTSNQWDDEQNPASDAFITSLSEATSPNDLPEVMVDDPALTSSTGTMGEEGRTFVDSITGLHGLQHRVYANDTENAHLFVAALQAGSQGLTPTFTKTITPANDPDLNFSNNEGFLYTVCRTVPSGHAYILYNALVRELVLTHNKNAQGLGRHAMLDTTWVGLRSSTVAAVSTASWGTQPSLSASGGDFTGGYLTLKFGSDSAIADICYNNLEVRFSNTVEVPCRTETGRPSNYRLVQPPNFITINIDLPYNANTKDLLADYAAGSTVEFTWTQGASGNDLIVDFRECQIIAPPGGYDGEYLSQRLSLRVLKPTAGFADSGTQNQVSITNSIDWGF